MASKKPEQSIEEYIAEIEAKYPSNPTAALGRVNAADAAIAANRAQYAPGTGQAYYDRFRQASQPPPLTADQGEAIREGIRQRMASDMRGNPWTGEPGGPMPIMDARQSATSAYLSTPATQVPKFDPSKYGLDEKLDDDGSQRGRGRPGRGDLHRKYMMHVNRFLEKQC